MAKQTDYTYKELGDGLIAVYKGDHKIGEITKFGRREFKIPDGYVFERKYLAAAFLDTDYTINLVKNKEMQIGEATIQHYELVISPEFHQYKRRGQFIGIDPGSAKCGLSIISGETMRAHCFEIRFLPCDDMIHKMYRVIEVFFALEEKYAALDRYVVVEGADYGSVFGQADLAMARALETYAFSAPEARMKILAPKKIRSITFRNGDKRAEEVWRFLPPNLASSLCAAISGLISFPDLTLSESENGNL